MELARRLVCTPRSNESERESERVVRLQPQVAPKPFVFVVVVGKQLSAKRSQRSVGRGRVNVRSSKWRDPRQQPEVRRRKQLPTLRPTTHWWGGLDSTEGEVHEVFAGRHRLGSWWEKTRSFLLCEASDLLVEARSALQPHIPARPALAIARKNLVAIDLAPFTFPAFRTPVVATATTTPAKQIGRAHV